MIEQYLEREGKFFFSTSAEKRSKLPAGVYQIYETPMGEVYLYKRKVTTDALFELDGSVTQKINISVRKFLDAKIRDGFKRYDIVYKRGVLLYGPPGTGKTSVVNLVISTAIKNDMVVLLNPEPYRVSGIVTNIRETEKNERPVMVVWEEFDKLLADEEEDMLDLLDGVYQLENTFYIATTNYIKSVPSRIRNRPSRFAEVIEIGSPDANLRREYLKAKVKKEDKIDIEDWVSKTDGFVLDHLKDLIISVLVMKVPLNESIEKLRALQADDKKLYEEEEKRVLNIGVNSPSAVERR